ncbi:MAG: hypothetical protein ACKOWG_07860, partial [Planctomycetia bacterium]
VEPDGPRHAILPRERVALTILVAVLFVLGLWPAPLVRALDRATSRLLGVAAETAPGPGDAAGGAAGGLQVLPRGS